MQPVFVQPLREPTTRRLRRQRLGCIPTLSMNEKVSWPSANDIRDRMIVGEFLGKQTHLDDSSFEALEKFVNAFMSNAYNIDFRKYAAKPKSFDPKRFRILPFLAAPLASGAYDTSTIVFDYDSEVGFPVDAPFIYVLATKPDVEKEEESPEWETLGAIAAYPDLAKKHFRVDQIQAAQGSRVSKSMRRQLRVSAGEEPNIAEVLFDIAHRFAHAQGMKVMVRKPEAGKPKIQARQKSGEDTPYSRVARKWNLSATADPTYYVES